MRRYTLCCAWRCLHRTARGWPRSGVNCSQTRQALSMHNTQEEQGTMHHGARKKNTFEINWCSCKQVHMRARARMRVSVCVRDKSSNNTKGVPRCTYAFAPMAKSKCMHSKAWLAASVRLRLARLPPPASRLRCSRRQSDTLAAAPGLLAHTCVTQ